MIDEGRIQEALRVFDKDCLPVLAAPGADIDQPGEPETGPVTDSIVAGSRQNLKQANAVSAQEPRAKTQTRLRSVTPLWGLHPTIRVLVEEGIGNEKRLPGWNAEPAGAEKLASYALLEGNAGILEIASEFNYID